MGDRYWNWFSCVLHVVFLLAFMVYIPKDRISDLDLRFWVMHVIPIDFSLPLRSCDGRAEEVPFGRTVLGAGGAKEHGGVVIRPWENHHRHQQSQRHQVHPLPIFLCLWDFPVNWPLYHTIQQSKHVDMWDCAQSCNYESYRHLCRVVVYCLLLPVLHCVDILGVLLVPLLLRAIGPLTQQKRRTSWRSPSI